MHLAIEELLAKRKEYNMHIHFKSLHNHHKNDGLVVQTDSCCHAVTQRLKCLVTNQMGVVGSNHATYLFFYAITTVVRQVLQKGATY